ncbi:MAG TPA: glycosyltransferase family 2 protein [Opitutaceae bacterium]|nr:glycosyltransferase family 2 protein [Opitutaceae bacterium]
MASSAGSPLLLSVVVPAYNEAENLPLLYQRVRALDWAALGLEYEFLVVDDHSTDGTARVIEELRAADPRVKTLRFSRNFGSHAACTAGLEAAGGAAAVVLAADLQDPPEIIPELTAAWRKGFPLVWAVRGEREGESWQTRTTARLFYFLIKRLTRMNMPPNGADFFLLDRVVLEALRATPERNTSLVAQIQWLGFDQTSLVYTKQARAAGESKWTLRKRLKLAMDWVVGFSYFPIRFMSALGLFFACAGFFYALFLVVRRFVFVVPVEGWTSLISVVLIMSGVQMVMLGVLGEYLWRSFDASRQRPRFIIERRRGI